MKNIIYERFDSIHNLLNTINSRPNNEIMKNKTDSQIKNSTGFFGTPTYDKAYELLVNGWDDPLNEIKKEVGSINYSGMGYKTRPQNAVVGYIPNVPNALQNLPQSMITINRIPQKVRAISIYYSNTADALIPTKEFVKNGIKLLNLVNSLESAGVRVNLYSVLFYAEKENDFTFVPVKIKDYRDKLDLKKICFPIAHASWLRRIGFKWLETCKGLTCKRWCSGYGIPISETSDHQKHVKILKNRKILNDSDLFFTFYEFNDLEIEEIANKILKK